MKKLVTVVFAVALLATTSGVAHATWHLNGGRLLQSGDDAVRTWVGFPGLGVAFKTPVSRMLELGPHFDFFYGLGHDVNVPFVGLTVGSTLKVRLYDSGKFALAFQADPSFRFVFHPGFAFGMRFGPMLLGSYDVASNVAVLFRFGLPFEMLFHPSFVFAMPIVVGGGVEFSVANNFNLYFTSDLGPDVWAVKQASSVVFYYRGEFGVGYKF